MHPLNVWLVPSCQEARKGLIPQSFPNRTLFLGTSKIGHSDESLYKNHFRNNEVHESQLHSRPIR